MRPAERTLESGGKDLPPRPDEGVLTLPVAQLSPPAQSPLFQNHLLPSCPHHAHFACVSLSCSHDTTPFTQQPHARFLGSLLGCVLSTSALWMPSQLGTQDSDRVNTWEGRGLSGSLRGPCIPAPNAALGGSKLSKKGQQAAEGSPGRSPPRSEVAGVPAAPAGRRRNGQPRPGSSGAGPGAGPNCPGRAGPKCRGRGLACGAAPRRARPETAAPAFGTPRSVAAAAHRRPRSCR